MSRVIQSPVKKWPGTVTLQDPLTFPAFIAWKNAVETAMDGREEGSDALLLPEVVYLILPGLCACVETWSLDGLGHLTPDTFPATPRRASFELFIWIVGEIGKLMEDADEVPNA